jgi:hypothetical protein
MIFRLQSLTGLKRPAPKAIHVVAHHRDAEIRLAMAAAGFAPITALLLAIVGVASLSITTLALVLPAAAVLAELAWLKPKYGRIALRGFLYGLVAVTLYDLFRLPLILSGLWGDFIPRIGMWLVPDGQPHPFIGYAYRYVGDGGGMGLAFVAAYPLLRKAIAHPVIAGIIFGLAIWACLMATLAIVPRAQEMMFLLTPRSVLFSLCGHLIYGSVLGLLVCRSPTMSALHPHGAAKNVATARDA